MKLNTLTLGTSLAMLSAVCTASSLQLPNSVKFNQPKLEQSNQRYIVLFKESTSLHTKTAKAGNEQAVVSNKRFMAERAISLVNKSGGKVNRTLPSVKGVSASLSAKQVAELRNDPQVALIEEDPLRTFQAEATPWGITKVQADQLSDANTGSVKICIPDTGIDINHEDLPAQANISGEVSNTLTVAMDIGQWNEDSYGHGTHMAGTIAAVGGNNVGIAGTNPGGHINLHMVKIVDNPNWWRFRGSDMIAAVEACQTAGANVINLSIAGQKSSVAEEQAMQAVFDAGILLIGASGKSGISEYNYPASYDSVVSVAAIDSQEAAWMYSHSNDQIELSAPGVKVKSTVPGNQYANWDGTSVATAHVSGVAGLVWSHHSQCSNSDIRNALKATAKDLGNAGRDNDYGHGLVQAKAALDYLDANGCGNSSPGKQFCSTVQGQSGVYTVDGQQVYCNMTIEGGGWTLVDTRLKSQPGTHTVTSALTDPATQNNQYLNKTLWQQIKAGSTELMVTDGIATNYAIFDMSHVDTASCAAMVDDLSKTPLFHHEPGCTFTGSDYTYLSNPNSAGFFTILTMYNLSFLPKIRSGAYDSTGKIYHAPEHLRVYVR